MSSSAPPQVSAPSVHGSTVHDREPAAPPTPAVVYLPYDYYDREGAVSGVVLQSAVAVDPSSSTARPTTTQQYPPSHQVYSNAPLPQPAMKPEWLYSLCHCCGHCNSCLEAYFCLFCQMARQYNRIENDKRGVSGLFLAGLIVGSFFFSPFVICVSGAYLRMAVRDRYRIRGNLCADGCAGCCCTCCAIQQNLLELTARGEFPGACCYDVEPVGGNYMV
ncbi:PLAC8 family, putative [Angomonas deanei]|uniref:PLAC8 family, putative n=1 Tax=Angomonas deanei TaxID=59799 RepID=A0A7G2CHL8_9TRYP|nr:PLAC8 family, putative [Angomonas deanei]